MSEEQRLTGGNVSAVYQKGEHVYRSQKENSNNVQRLLPLRSETPIRCSAFRRHRRTKSRDPDLPPWRNGRLSAKSIHVA